MSSTRPRIAILGAGPGGLAGVAALARRGFDVALFNRSAERIESVQAAGGIAIEGDLGEEFVPVGLITTDIAEALEGRDLVLCFTPANGQRVMAELAAPHLREGTAFVLASGSAGSLEVARIFAAHGLDARSSILLGETITLPQSARLTDDARLRIRLPSNVRLAAFPAVNNDSLYALMDGVITFPAIAARPRHRHQQRQLPHPSGADASQLRGRRAR